MSAIAERTFRHNVAMLLAVSIYELLFLLAFVPAVVGLVVALRCPDAPARQTEGGAHAARLAAQQEGRVPKGPEASLPPGPCDRPRPPESGAGLHLRAQPVKP